MDKIKPIKLPHITVQERYSPDQTVTYILKDPINNEYFMLSTEALFIWELLDGYHTIQDIAIEFLFHYNQLAEDEIGELILTLMNHGFVNMPQLSNHITLPKKPVWQRSIQEVASVLTWQYSISNVDEFISRLYKNIGYIFYKNSALLIMMLIAIFGILGCIGFLPQAQATIATSSYAWLYFLLICPANILTVPIHEIAHALTTKHYGYKVNRLGFGWFWLGPIAFADTSEMWLANKKQRLHVNIAGIYSDVVIAGILMMVAYIIPNPHVAAFLWLLSISSYILAFCNLNTIFELDGYYILMDAFDRPNLRKTAIVWAIQDFGKTFLSISLLKKYIPEISYWLSCLAFIILSSLLAYFIQVHVLLHVFPHIEKAYLEDYRWLLAAIVIILSFTHIYSLFKDGVKQAHNYGYTPPH